MSDINVRLEESKWSLFVDARIAGLENTTDQIAKTTIELKR